MDEARVGNKAHSRCGGDIPEKRDSAVPTRSGHGKAHARADQAIRQARARAQAYLDVAEVILIALNSRGEVELINRKGCLILGYREDELIGRDWFTTCLTRRDSPIVRKAFERLIAGDLEAVEYYENPVVSKTGEERLIAWHNALVRDEDGVIIGILASGEDITDRRRAEEELRQSEEKYHQIFSQALEGIYQTTPEGRYISLNPAFARMFGYASPEEMLSSINDIGHQIYVHPEDRERLKELLNRDGQVEGFEAEVYRKDGARIWISINAHVVRGENGAIRYYEGTDVDITARKKNELALKAVLEGTIAFVGRDYFASLVRKLAEVLGVRYAFIGELIPGQPGCIRTISVDADGKAVDPEIYALSNTPSEQVLATGLCVYPQDVQSSFPRDDELKHRHVVSYMGTPLYSRQKELLGLLAVMDDKPMEQGALAQTLLTIFAARAGAELERMRTDAALLESEGRYRYLVENSHALVAEISIDRRFHYISPNHRQYLGYDQTELMQFSITDLVHPDDLPQILPKLDQPEGTAVFRYRHKDGSWRWLDAAGRRFLTPTGEERIVVVSRDITDQKQAEQERQSLQEQLVRAQKMESIGRLAGGVAHDFNNLLTPILGYTDMLLDALAPDDPHRELVLPIHEAAEHARDLTRQLLVFSRKQALELKVVDLGGAIVRFQKLLRRTIRDDIWITVNVAPSLGLVKADIGQIEQVFMNLAVNAQDAMPKGGMLAFELKDVDLDKRFTQHYPGTNPGPYVLITVTDTGIGMHRDALEHLFEPFFTTKTPGQGTGLGLSIVHGIVKQHGGIICCQSQPGHGTTFKIYLPRHTEAVIQPREDTLPRDDLKRGNETVLIVDDSPAVRDLASHILRHQGYQVIVAESADHCLEIVDRQRERINLLLTDLIMPVMNGRELYERLHSVQPAMKVLYMSSYTDDIVTRHGIEPEAVSFIQKPFTIETLAARVRNVLDTSVRREH